MYVEVEVIAHDTSNYIGTDIVPRVTEMCIVVDRRPARIPGDFLSLGIYWDKGRLRPGKRVEDLQRREMRLRLGVDSRLPP